MTDWEGKYPARRVMELLSVSSSFGFRGLPERRQCVILVSWRYISDLWDQDTILFVTVVVSMIVTRPMCSGDPEMGVSVSPFQSCHTISGS